MMAIATRCEFDAHLRGHTGGHISPVVGANRRTNDPKPDYFVSPCLSSVLQGEEAYVVLDAVRREAIREREGWATLKKQCGADRDCARFCKDEERLWLRRYRAICTLFGWSHAPVLGDCQHREVYGWDAEFATDLNWAVTATLGRLWRGEATP